MNLICSECKNNVDLSAYKDLKIDQNIECNVCGISLIITKVSGDIVEAEVTDEGK
jgi:DNA-directed RNA polymerase subunit RPC12/RpoP